MRRARWILAGGLVAAAVMFAVGTGASNDDGAYRVRAVFNNAFTIIPGLDVKVAGVRVGQVDELEVTPENQAAVVLRIDDPAFQDFRVDASCTIRPQGLIGEKFVECQPTQPRRDGAALPAELSVINAGAPGAGQRLLPVERTAKPVDIDLLNDALRLPYRERVSLIINELGAAVAGRGEALRGAVRRLDPALQETDKVLKILADQNDVLADLVVQSDTALAPLAADRGKVQSFVANADRAARAQAQVRPELEATLKRLPRALDELRPTMTQLGAFADEAGPVASDLRAAAPALSRFLVGLGPFAAGSTTAVRSLGATAQTGGKALINSKATIDRLGSLAAVATPVSIDLQNLTESLQERGVFERLLTSVFYLANTQNGFDDLGYYQRGSPLAGSCASYATEVSPECTQQVGTSLKEPLTVASGTSAVQAVATPARRSSGTRRTSTGPLAVPVEIRGTPAPTAAPKTVSATTTSAADPEAQVAEYLLGDQR